MIEFLDAVSYVVQWAYVLVFYLLLHSFLSLRKNILLRILAFFVGAPIFVVIVYSNDLANLLAPLVGFVLYTAVFFSGDFIEKLTAVLVFYPAVIGVNYLMQDIGSRVFFGITNAPPGMDLGWTKEMLFMSSFINMVTIVGRLVFWLAAWALLRKYLKRIMENLTFRMWLIVDILLLAPITAIFIIIYFLPGEIAVVYPICIASVISSFGGIGLAAYISDSLRTEYGARELEAKLSYYKDKTKEEERVRRVYHDMKNHLLVLQAKAEASRELGKSIESLQEEIEGYEAYCHTGNDFLDVVIRDKIRAAKSRNIDFQEMIRFGDGGFIDPLDISTIFGNALDNAIEASEKLAESMRLITVKASRIHDMLVVAVENNMQPDMAPLYGKTSKKDTLMHGFGIANIQSAAEKYGGQCTARTKDGKFVLKVIIPVP